MNTTVEPSAQHKDFAHYLRGDYRLGYVRPGTCFVFLSTEPDDSAVVFSDAELKAVDERLPAIIEGMTSSEFRFRRRVSTNWVRNTLSYMDDPVAITDIFKMQYLVKLVSGISFLEKDRSGVTLSVMYYDFVRLEPVPYITDIKESFITVATTELDKFYPGWLTRYDMLCALGSSKDELVTGSFTRSSVQSTNESVLNTVTFE